MGDSLIGQSTDALECLAGRSLGDMQPFSIALELPELRMQCDKLSLRMRSKRAEERRSATFAWVHAAWPCRHLNASALRFDGYRSEEWNLTVIPRLGSQANLILTPEQMLHGGVAWPSRTQMVQARDLADVVVLGFGLHYHTEKAMEDAVSTALSELEALVARRPHAIGLLRESSAQHYAVRGGDYDAAVRHSRALVEIPKSPDSEPPPSACAPLADDAPVWRNQVLRRVVAARRLLPRVAVLPFEALTRPRWDYHSATKRSGFGRSTVWAFDCTHASRRPPRTGTPAQRGQGSRRHAFRFPCHGSRTQSTARARVRPLSQFCFSPSFWDASLHELATTLRAVDERVRRQKRQAADMRHEGSSR